MNVNGAGSAVELEAAKLRFAEAMRLPRDTHFYPLPTRPIRGAPDDLHGVGGEASLYVHLPFCMARCTYCFFVTQIGHGADDMEQYVAAELAEELRLLQSGLARYDFTSLYYGGGTPGLLNPDTFRRLHDLIAPFLSPVATITLETHPCLADAKRIKAWRDCGVDRISMGVQTTDSRELALINRGRQDGETIDATRRLLEAGFDDVNADLLYGLPGQDMASWEATLDAMLETGIPSLSIYITTFIPQTRAAFRELGVAPPPAQLTRDMYHLAWEKLNAAGYTQPRYGCSTFSNRNYALGLNVHRQHVVAGAPMVGVGMGAYGSIPGYTYVNLQDREAYQRALQDGRLPVMMTMPVPEEERAHKYTSEAWKTGFISCAAYEKAFGEPIEARFGSVLEALIALGELQAAEGEYRLTRQGAGRAHVIADMFLSDAAREHMAARRAAAAKAAP